MNHDDSPQERKTLQRVSLQLGDPGHDLNLKQLYYFHAVASEGTIARAAKKLRVSQATVSEQLKNLENYLEQTLLDRHTTGVRLNQYGRRVFEHTTAMFRAVNRMLQDINPARARERWVLEIGLCPSVSRTFALHKFLPLFQLDQVSLRIRHGNYPDLMTDLLSGEIDMVLSENAPTSTESSKVGCEVLVDSPLLFVAHPALAEQVKDFPADLGNLPFLGFSHASHYRRLVEDFFIERGLAPDVLGEVDDISLLTLAAHNKLCFVAVPQSVLQTADALALSVLGEVEGARSRVYAQFPSVRTPDVVQRAIALLRD